MLESATEGAFRNGERTKLIPVRRLESLKDELDRFKAEEELNGFQRWILEELYSLGPPEDFPARSIILIALPHPFSADLEFVHAGRAYRCRSLVMSDFDAAERRLRSALPGGHRIAAAKDLPLKRLAVQSGLARYGRNNICYIEGMGSNFSLAAFFSDEACGEGDWAEARVASPCAGCDRCVEACPTGAIRPDRFLIDNERCLSCLNESGDPFPSWLDPRIHHSAYDCLRCQECCPMNAAERQNTVGPVLFDEAETELLLSGSWLEEGTPTFIEKARYLGLHQWPGGVALSLRAIMDAARA